MSAQTKSMICDIINKNPQAQGVYQFEVIRSLVTNGGNMTKFDIVSNLIDKSGLSRGVLNSHCVWRVLANKSAIKISADKTQIQLVGFEDLTQSEQNEIRNQANQARRNWEAKNL